jgi:hypothetical protein
MAETRSLWEFLRELVTNGGLRDWFAEDPQGALRANGLDHLSPDDVHDALVLAEDNQTADFSRDYDAGHSTVGWSPPVAVAGESEHEAAVRYLNSYITSYHVDDRDTVVDHGGDFDQDIDAHSAVASGDGAVAAGGDIDGSTITTGDHDTIAFGSGGTGNTHTDNSVDDSFADSSDHSVADSFTTHVDASTHDSFDDDGEHSTSHVWGDDSTHVDNSTDHVGNVEH